MKRLSFLLSVLLVVGCAFPASHYRMAPVDTTSHGGGFESLVIAALIVLVLIPTLTPKRQ